MDLLPVSLRKALLSDTEEFKDKQNLLEVKLFGGWAQFKSCYRSQLAKQRALKEGDKVPELEVVNFVTKKVATLTELMRPGVPLVLNFGSCT